MSVNDNPSHSAVEQIICSRRVAFYFLEDQHTVAVAKEMVFFGDTMLIGWF